MSLNEEINRIEEFFNNLTDEEFEQMVIEAGIEEIGSSTDFGMELLYGDTMALNYSYIKEKKVACVGDENFDYPSNLYTGAA